MIGTADVSFFVERPNTIGRTEVNLKFFRQGFEKIQIFSVFGGVEIAVSDNRFKSESVVPAAGSFIDKYRRSRDTLVDTALNKTAERICFGFSTRRAKPFGFAIKESAVYIALCPAYIWLEQTRQKFVMTAKSAGEVLLDIFKVGGNINQVFFRFHFYCRFKAHFLQVNFKMKKLSGKLTQEFIAFHFSGGCS